MHKGLRSLAQPIASVGLLLTLAIWWPLLVLRGAVSDWWQPLQLVSVRICLALLVVQLLSGAMRAFRDSQPTSRWYAMWCCSTLAVVIAAGFPILHRFDGTFTLAEGESYQATPALFSHLDRGYRADIPRFSFVLRKVAERSGEKTATIDWPGHEEVFGHQGVSLEGYRLRFLNQGVALLCTVKNREGSVLEEGYVKLDLRSPGDEDTFMFPYLPFEFSFTKTKGNDFTVEVQRGKLSIFKGTLAIGTSIAFQELELTLRDERKTAQVQLSRFPGKTTLMVTVALWLILSLASIGRYLLGKNDEA